jgi:hypothetical protein
LPISIRQAEESTLSLRPKGLCGKVYFFCPSFANVEDGFIVSFPVYFQGMSGWQPGRSEVVTGSRSVSHQAGSRSVISRKCLKVRPEKVVRGQKGPETVRSGKNTGIKGLLVEEESADMRVGFFPAVAVERFSALHIGSEEPHFL